ncbi:hypothetical protein ACQ4LE_005673 [Meloidogyne hapla]
MNYSKFLLIISTIFISFILPNLKASSRDLRHRRRVQNSAMIRDWPVFKYPNIISNKNIKINKNEKGITSNYPLGIHPMCFFTSLPCPDSYNKLRKIASKRGENNRNNKRELKIMEKINKEDEERVQAVPVEQQKEEKEEEDYIMNEEKENKEGEKINEIPDEKEENEMNDEELEELLKNEEEIDDKIKNNKIEEEKIKTKKFLRSLKIGCPLRILILCRGQKRFLELNDENN